MKLSGFTKGLLLVALIAIGYTIYDYTQGEADWYEVGFIVLVLGLAAWSWLSDKPANLNNR